jgi:ABC-type multidrug transport system ATPase subunit
MSSGVDSVSRAPGDGSLASGVSIEARGLSRTVRGRIPLLQEVSLSLAPSELVAIVEGSGAGKTTLLEALAGTAPADRGQVLFDVHLYADRDAFRSVLGYVPQDDIIHLDLPVERTLRYAARLRLPVGTSAAEAEARVQGALRELNLAERAGTAVGALSGGQRERASIAVEMLTDPRVFFLDEPTSGLDPATGAELIDTLRSLADRGATVLFTTHAIEDLARCDRVVFLAPGGRLAFVGTLTDALAHFGVSSVSDIYRLLGTGTATAPSPQMPSPDAARAPMVGGARVGRRTPGAVSQWLVLTQRTFESFARNPLTLAILLGAPAMVVAMFAILFNAGTFDFADPDPTSILMIVFWITFGAFFFGLTYGLLQIVTERAILRREYLVGLRLS